MEGELRKAISEESQRQSNGLGLVYFLRDKGSIKKCREFENAVQSIFNVCKKMVGSNAG